MSIIFDPFSVLGAVLSAAALLRSSGKKGDAAVLAVFRKLDPVIEMVRFAKNVHNAFHPIKDTMLSGFLQPAKAATATSSVRGVWESLSKHLHGTLESQLHDLPWDVPTEGGNEATSEDQGDTAIDGIPVSRETRQAAKTAARNCRTLAHNLRKMLRNTREIDDAVAKPDLPDNFLQLVENLRVTANAILGCCDSLIKNSVVVLVEVYDGSIALASVPE